MYIRALARHPIKVGRQIKRIAVDTSRIPALLVGKEDDDVGLVGTGLGHGLGSGVERQEIREWEIRD